MHKTRKKRKKSNRFSPDLAPFYFHMFGNLKENLGGRKFSNDDQVQTAVLSWLQDQGPILYRQGIQRLGERSEECQQRVGDCKEELHVFVCHSVL